MSRAFKCDFCKTLYDENDIGASLGEFRYWRNYLPPANQYWLAKIVFISNGHDPYKSREQDICPDCSMKIANFLKTLEK